MSRTPEAVFDALLVREKMGNRVVFNFRTTEKKALAEWLKIGVIAAEWVNNSPGTTKKVLPHCYYVHDLSLNMFATIAAGYDFIGVNLGTPLLLRHVFMRLLAHPNFLPDIGDPSKEEPPPALGKLPKEINEMGRPIQPKDSARRLYAQFMYEASMGYLLFHEIAHLYNGHVGYCCNKYSLTALGERPTQNLPLPLNSLTIQAMEMDADSFAMGRAVQNVLNLASSSTGLERELVSTKEAHLKLLGVSVYMLWRLFFDTQEREVSRKKIESLAQEEYPPMPIRNMWLYSSMMGTLMNHHGYEVEHQRFGPELRKSIIEASESAISVLLGKEIKQRELDYAIIFLHPEAQAHLKRVEERFQEIRPDLLRFARTNYLP